jgi:hypothetical protein
MSENFYQVEILGSDLDAFLILGYVVVLDRAKMLPHDGQLEG